MPFETSTIARRVAAVTAGMLLLLPAAAHAAEDLPSVTAGQTPSPASSPTADRTTPAGEPAAETPAVPLAITPDRTLVSPGKALSGNVDGLVPDEDATVVLEATFDGGPAALPCNVTVREDNTTGTFECEVPGSQAEGSYRLALSQKDAEGNPRSANSADIYVLEANKYDPQISGPTLPVAPGTAPALKGSGYRPGGTVTVESSNSFFIPGGVADVDKQGDFGVSLRTSSFTPEGQYSITVTDDITGVKRELSFYVLRATPTLGVTRNTGIQGEFSTSVQGEGFADGSYDGALKLYAADGTTEVATLAERVTINGTKLPETAVTIPAWIGQGLYQLAVVVPEGRLAASWIAVFPKPAADVTPTAPAPPVIVPPSVVVPPVAKGPVKEEPELPFLHQAGTVQDHNPFVPAAARQATDLNASSPLLGADGSGTVAQDPTPQAEAADTTEPQAPEAAPVVQVKTSQEAWPLVLVGLISIIIGLAAGFLISRAQRGRNS